MAYMPLRRSAPLLAGLFGLALLAAACAGGSSATSGSSPAPSSPAVNATAAADLPTDAYALPSFDYERFQVLLGELEGTPVVVNIWASWCGPCRTEAPHLAAAAAEHGDRVQFLGVDILDSRTSARAFMREFGWTYPSLFDETGEIRDRLGFIGQPVTIFYDASGKLLATWQGPLTPARLTRYIEQLLATGA